MAALARRAHLTRFGPRLGYLFSTNLLGFVSSLLIACGGDDDAAKENVALFAALKIGRPRKTFMAIEGAAGDAGDFLVVDDGRTIQDDCDSAADQSNVVRLPLVRGAGGLRRRSEKTVNTAQAPLGRIGDGVGFELDFIAAAQIDAAVALVRAVVFDMQLEILEFGIINQFRTIPRAY